jgi:hypothetical protein
MYELPLPAEVFTTPALYGYGYPCTNRDKYLPSSSRLACAALNALFLFLKNISYKKQHCSKQINWLVVSYRLYTNNLRVPGIFKSFFQ